MKMKANKSLDTIHMPMVEWKPQRYKAEHPNDNLSEHLDCSAKQAELLGKLVIDENVENFAIIEERNKVSTNYS